MHLFLIRHGASIHSQRKIVAGRRSCLGLTDAGIAQGRRLAARFEWSGELGLIDHFFTSPIRRARETADLLQPVIAVPLVEDERLEELRPGQADGLTWEEAAAQYGHFDMTTDPSRAIFPEGESLAEFSQRVQTTLAALATQYAGQRLLIVSHGGFIMASLLTLLAIPRPGTSAHIHAHNTSITEWTFENKRWNLLRFGDIAHLTEGFPSHGGLDR